METNEVITLIEERRDKLGRSRPRREERMRICKYLRERQKSGDGFDVLGKELGLHPETVKRWSRGIKKKSSRLPSAKNAEQAGRRPSKKLLPLRLQSAGSQGYVLQAPHQVSVRCDDAGSAATLLQALSRVG